MSKKVFTFLLLAVFVLAQFSAVAAAPQPIATTNTTPNALVHAATIVPGSANIATTWSYTVTNVANTAGNVMIWARIAPAATWAVVDCRVVPGAGVKAANLALGIYTGAYTFIFAPMAPVAGQTVEFTTTVDDQATCALATLPVAAPTIKTTALVTNVTTGTLGLANASHSYLPPSQTSLPITYSLHLSAATTVVQNVLIWSAGAVAGPFLAINCRVAATLPIGSTGVQTASFVYDYATAPFALVPAPVQGSVVRFFATVDANTCATATIPAVGSANMSQTIMTDKQTTAAVTLTAVDTFNNATVEKLVWSVTNPAALTALTGPQYVYAWARKSGGTFACRQITTIPVGVAAGNGTYDFTFAAVPAVVVADQNKIEYAVTVEKVGAAVLCAAAATTPPIPTVAMSSTTIDGVVPVARTFLPPNKVAVVPPQVNNQQAVACNTFEYWGLTSDTSAAWTLADKSFSGVKSWNQKVTGLFASPAPVGTAPTVLSWANTFPASANGPWSFQVNPTDAAGNAVGALEFRGVNPPVAAELAACKSFTDVVGDANEAQIRYLGSLGVINGNTTTTFNPKGTLTRAEIATLLMNADGGALPATPSTGCTFTDVATTDWFAKYVWGACAKGYMVGVSAGKFDPANTFTRGQAVTVFNNIATGKVATASGFFTKASASYMTVVNTDFAADFNWVDPYRSIAWTDVAPGAFYADGANRAYNIGVAEATGATTFSPDQPVLRGEFARMLYRALSRLN